MRPKKLKYKIFVLLLGLAIFPKMHSQDPQFSQFYSSLLYLSPSFAGSSGGSRLVLNFRDQWPKLPSTYITYAGSFDHYFEKYRSGVGVLFFRDDAGDGLLSTTNLGLQYSFNFDLNNIWSVRPGLHFYYRFRDIDFNRLQFSDQISFDYISPSSIELPPQENVVRFDAATSVLVYSDIFWFGATVDHLMSISPSLADEVGYRPMRYSVFGGGKYIISRRTRSRKEESLSGAFNFMAQDKFKYLDLGAYYINQPLMVGLWYRGLPVFPNNRNAGAITVLFGYQYRAFTFQYSYDFSTSKLITKTGGAHEVSLTYLIASKDFSKRRRLKMVPCPEFLSQ